MAKSKGNMYPWAAPWNPLAGECPHKCSYCSTKSLMFRPACKAKYTGELRLDEKAMKKNLGRGNTWFVCAQNDLFASPTPDYCIRKILMRCHDYNNFYVFQTKNPWRYFEWGFYFPRDFILGCTIESNRNYSGISEAMLCADRAYAMINIGCKKFITIEPIMDFDLDVLSGWIKEIKPDFVNIGADSKRHNLPEPSPEKVKALIAEIQNAGIEIREKHNLERLLK